MEKAFQRENEDSIQQMAEQRDGGGTMWPHHQS